MKACGRMMRFLEKIFNAALKLVKEKLNKNTNRPMIDEAFMLNHICKSRKRHTTNQGFKTQMMVGKTRSLAKNDIRALLKDHSLLAEEEGVGRCLEEIARMYYGGR